MGVRAAPSPNVLSGFFRVDSLARLKDHSSAPTCGQDRRERRRGQGGSASLILAWISDSMAPQRGRCIVTAKQAAVKKSVAKLSDGERERLKALIHTGKHRAGQLVKARILLKADASGAGEGWSGSEIAAALDTSVNTVAR